MQHLLLTADNLGDMASQAAEIVRGGGVVLYPTETLYGLGADALSDAAVQKLYEIKGRPEGKPIHALVADIEMAARFGAIDERAQRLVAHIHKPISIIVQKHAEYTSGILKNLDTFGFRIATHPFCRALVRAFGGPITTTSANRAGRLPYRGVPAILEQLGPAASGIGLIVDAGELPEREPSTIVDLSGSHPEILREGTVSAEEIQELLKREGV